MLWTADKDYILINLSTIMSLICLGNVWQLNVKSQRKCNKTNVINRKMKNCLILAVIFLLQINIHETKWNDDWITIANEIKYPYKPDNSPDVAG